MRGSRPGKNVQLTETEIRGLCLKSRELFLSQPILLELEAPLKICGESTNTITNPTVLEIPLIYTSFCERRRILWYWRELLCGLSQYVSGTSDKGLVAGNIFRHTNIHCTFETPILDQKFWWGCIRVLTLLWCHDLHDRHLKRHPCWSIWGSVDVFTLKSTLLKFRYNNQTEQFAIITESNDTVKTYWRKIHLF